MLRETTLLLRGNGLKSHQITGAGYPFARNRFARRYNRAMMKYGADGFGVSTYSVRKAHLPTTRPQGTHMRVTPATNADSFTQAHTLLSPLYRSYALDDGGVLFTHPSHKQLMAWSGQVIDAEAKQAGGAMTAMQEQSKARVDAIMTDNTLENQALTSWRRKHLWRLIKAKTDQSNSAPERHNVWAGVYADVRNANRVQQRSIEN